jgi:hypothetical protein
MSKCVYIFWATLYTSLIVLSQICSRSSSLSVRQLLLRDDGTSSLTSNIEAIFCYGTMEVKQLLNNLEYEIGLVADYTNPDNMDRGRVG